MDEMMGLVKCSQCGKDVNPKSALCPFCGERLGDEKSFGSPVWTRCRIPRDCQSQDDIDIHACPQCNGLWLDPGEFDVFTVESTIYREEQFKKEYSRPPLPNKIEYLPCARCEKLMVEQELRSYIRVDHR